MLVSFSGAAELVNSYDSCLTNTRADLVVVQGALGESAIRAAGAAARSNDLDDRTARLQEVLYNALPLSEAEQLIMDWAKGSALPEDFLAYSSLEGSVAERTGETISHFDTATAPNELIHGPFAMSIGTSGRGLFKGIRLDRRLRDDELLGESDARILKLYERLHTERGRFKPGSQPGQTVQNPGDIVLIPGSPQPSLHAVEPTDDKPRTSVISSYIFTTNQLASPAELRKRRQAERDLEMRIMQRALRRHLGGRTISGTTRPEHYF